MTDIYSAEQRARDLHPSSITVLGQFGNVTFTTRPFAGERWFALSSDDGANTVAVSYDELVQLVSGAEEALRLYAPTPPTQLRLFDPDALEDSDADRLDPA